MVSDLNDYPGFFSKHRKEKHNVADENMNEVDENMNAVDGKLNTFDENTEMTLAGEPKSSPKSVTKRLVF